MKKLLAALSLLVLSGAVIAADQSDQDKLKESLAKWRKAKQSCNGNYSYKVTWASFIGSRGETQIIVRGNKVVGRSYREFGPPQPLAPGQKPPEGKGWDEKGKDLGSHKQGAAIKTLDQLYEEAAQVLKRDLPQHKRRYLRFDKQGLLLSCFTVDTRIADDAPTPGVKVSSIQLGGKGEGQKPKKVYKAPNGKPFPAHWGAPPLRQTRDLRPLPGGYGRGSGTLARWIGENMEEDKKRQ